MRMRKKKHLEEKLACCDNLFTMESDDRNFNTAINKKEYFDYKEIFGNDNEVWLEVGCGKGQFIVEEASRHPEINYIAVEKCANVIVTACQSAKEKGLKNVLFVRCSAEYLTKYLRPESIGRIYLNFSCPFPKKKYASHRLTSERFLDIYRIIMKKGAEIHQKTDNMHFFEFSIEQFTNKNYKLKNISLDLHNSDFEGNIVTEYEERFSSQGFPIYRLEAYIKDND